MPTHAQLTPRQARDLLSQHKADLDPQIRWFPVPARPDGPIDGGPLGDRRWKRSK